MFAGLALFVGLHLESLDASAAVLTPPQLQIDGGMHTAPIVQIRAAVDEARLVTVSADRTARIWQLPNLRLLHTIRVPAADGFEGLLEAVAIQPGGPHLAIGGFTGPKWSGGFCIYLHHMATARLLRTLCGFEDIIRSLAFSPDGRTLAIGLGGPLGLRLLDTSTWKETQRDTQFGAAVRYMAYSKDGLLAVTAADGYLRMYSPDGKLIGRRRLREDSRSLGGVRFAPDGQTMAIGIVDRPAVMLVSTRTFETVVTRNFDDADQKGLCCVAFSADGAVLYVNGRYAGKGPTPLYQLAQSGMGSISRLDVGDQSFTNMAPLPDGHLVLSTAAPTLSIMDPRGRVLRSLRAPTADFRRGASALAVNQDGSEVTLPMRENGADPLTFNVIALKLAEGRPASPLAHARLASKGWALDASPDTYRPMLNGKPLVVESNERVLSHAFSPDNRFVLLGTYWHIRGYDADGRQVLQIGTSAPVHNLLVSPDGAKIVATLGDGTVRWYDHQTGQELLVLYVHANRKDWVLWRPDGYYVSSDEGDQYVGWLINRGVEQEPDFFRAVQFERILYRPDLVKAAWKRVPPVLRGAASADQNASSPDIEALLPPRVRLHVADKVRRPDGSMRYTIRMEAERLNQPMQEAVVYVAGIPVTPSAARRLGSAEKERLARDVTVDVADPEGVVRVEVAANGLNTAMGLAEISLEGGHRTAPARAVGDLHVVAIGVNQFPLIKGSQWPGGDPTLDAAAADAHAMAEQLRKSARGLYRQVKVTEVSDLVPALPNKQQVMDALASLARTEANDTAIVFMASHGISDAQGNYYFIPRDAHPDDVAALLKGQSTAPLASLISWTEIFDALREASGRRILIVDTCQARDVAAEHQAHSLRKRSAASLFALTLASQGAEMSQELAAVGHGIFTYGLLEALNGKAKAGPLGLSLGEAFAHAKEVVASRRPVRRLPQTPQLFAPGRLAEVLLAAPPESR